MIIISDNAKYNMELKDLANMLLAGKRDVQIYHGEEAGAHVFQQEEDVIELFRKGEFVHGKLYKSGDELFCMVSDINFKEKLLYKKILYRILTTYYDVSGKWGILTGIRPVKIVNELKSQGMDDTQISDILREKYLISPQKSKLMRDISKVQEEMISKLKDDVSIYFSIPFCPSRCNYCSFFSLDLNTGKKYMAEYLRTLRREVEESLAFDYFRDKKISTLYVGGGTPSSLEPRELGYFFSIIGDNFDLDSIMEYTFEAGRADTLNEEKLRIIKNNRVSRISINPQSMNDETLVKIGRNHNSEDVRNIYSAARKIGFDDINMDLILGLADEGVEDMRRSVDEIISMDPESITVHCLAIKRASVMGQNQIKNRYMEISEYMSELIDRMYAHGYEPYYLYRQKNMLENGENIGFAKRGKYNLYNVAMMDEVQSIIGFGVGSSSKILYPESNLLKRIPNYKDVLLYNQNIDTLITRKRFELQ